VKECIFECGEAEDDTMIGVEMNRDALGEFHANQNHLNQAERVSGFAHLHCYKRWYERTYGTPFTMSA
jgi:hypothetical protein